MLIHCAETAPVMMSTLHCTRIDVSSGHNSSSVPIGSKLTTAVSAFLSRPVEVAKKLGTDCGGLPAGAFDGMVSQQLGQGRVRKRKNLLVSDVGVK